MDFFARQEEARRRTVLMLALFAAAVVAIIAALYKVAGFVFLKRVPPAGVDWELLGWVGGITSAVILGGSWHKTSQLRRGGGAAVAELLGGRPLPPDATDARERRLLNVVEEMAIASGVPIPAVYVLEEPGVNAFVAGYTPADAVLAVTRGCLDRLTRDELQGVVAHEFSHLLNGDMRLNIRLMGLVHGILLIALAGYHSLRLTFDRSVGGSRAKRSGGPFVLVSLALLVVGSIGVLFANLIKAAVSRSREFLADASAVQFTRNPRGLAGALKKIGGLAAGSTLESENAAQASHFYFARGVDVALFDVFATHPPLAERVRRLDPAFRGEFAEVPGDFLAPLDEETPVVAAALAPRAGAASPAGFGAAPDPAAVAGAVERVGTLTAEGVSYAGALLAALPPRLLATARTPEGARAVMLALLVDRRPEVREAQGRALVAGEGATPRAAVAAALADLASLDPRLRLPLADVAAASLRPLDAGAAARFAAEVDALVAADGRISLAELMLAAMVRRRLQPYLGPPDHGGGAAGGGSLSQAAAVLVGAFARASSDKQGAIRRAYDAGAREIFGERAPAIPDAAACAPERVREALATARRAAPAAKKRVLRALAKMAVADGAVTVEEAELLRAVADGLGCPVPPLTATPAGAAAPVAP